MKYERLICAALLMGLSLPAFGEVGELKPIAVTPRIGILRQPFFAGQPESFADPKPGDGTVNPKAKVVTLNGGDGKILVAIDSKKPDAKCPDVLRFDFSGEGKFNDTLVVPLTRQGRNYRISSQTLQVSVGDKTIPIQVEGRYIHQRNWRYLYLHIGTALMGQCAFGEKVYPIYLVDGTNNLSCLDTVSQDEKHGNIPFGDRVFFGAINTLRGRNYENETFLGQLVKVGGQWYELNVSDDLKISATPVEVETTKAHIPHDKWNATLLGKRFTLHLSGTAEPFEIPVDTYRFYYYQQKGTGRDVRMQLHCYYSGVDKSFALKPGEVNELSVGPPLTARIKGFVQGDHQVNLQMEIVDAAGLNVSYLVNTKGDRPAPPSFEIFDESGKSVYSGKMEFG